MFALLRNIVILFVLLTIVYALLSFLARFRERARLSAEWEAQSELRKQSQDRETFIALGMRAYARSYRPKLILGVYIVPAAVIGLLLYLAQVS